MAYSSSARRSRGVIKVTNARYTCRPAAAIPTERNEQLVQTKRRPLDAGEMRLIVWAGVVAGFPAATERRRGEHGWVVAQVSAAARSRSKQALDASKPPDWGQRLQAERASERCWGRRAASDTVRPSNQFHGTRRRSAEGVEGMFQRGIIPGLQVGGYNAGLVRASACGNRLQPSSCLRQRTGTSLSVQSSCAG